MRQIQSWPYTARGFTLLEIMIVLVIIGVLSGLVLVSFGVLEQRRTVAEAKRLKLTFNQAADMALMQQETLGWFYQSQTKQYSLKLLDRDAEWIALEQTLFAPYTLKPLLDIIVSSEVTDEFNKILDTKPDTTTDTEPKITEDHGSEQPAILFFSSGEYSPFELDISDQNRSLIQLFGDGFSAIKIKTSEPG